MRILKPLFTLAILVGLAYLIYYFFIFPIFFAYAKVIHVVDADTLLILDNKKPKLVQLAGVDSPEYVEKNQSQECFGEDARNMVATEYFNKESAIRLTTEKEISDKDESGRYMRYITLKNGDLYNEKVLQEGLGQMITLADSKKYRFQDRFEKAQTDAKQKGLGIWNAEGCNGQI